MGFFNGTLRNEGAICIFSVVCYHCYQLLSYAAKPFLLLSCDSKYNRTLGNKNAYKHENFLKSNKARKIK